MDKNTYVLCGASSAIATAAIALLLKDKSSHIAAFSRRAMPATLSNDLLESGDRERIAWIETSYDEDAIANACQYLSSSLSNNGQAIKAILVFNGVLHDKSLQPERALNQLKRRSLTQVFESNALVPINWIQQLVPLIAKEQDVVITVLSARIGSITDNQLGGWHSYRASKAALNMLLKNVAIELARRRPQVKLIAFHPGTTDTPLSKPFQKNVPTEKLFQPRFVAKQLLEVIDNAHADAQLSFIDWANKPIAW